MHERLVIGLSILTLYLLLGTVLALISRKRLAGDIQDYFIAKGKLGGFLSAMTYAATTYSGFMIVGLVGFAYFTGTGALGFELAYYVATIGLLALFARRVRKQALERKWVTPSQMLGDIYGSRVLAALVALIYLVALIPYASSQLKSIGESFAGLAGGYYEWGVLLGLIIIIVWSSIAGIWSVAVTDALQGLWMIFSALLLTGYVLYFWSQTGHSLGYAWRILDEKHLAGLSPFWTVERFLAFTLPWIFFAVTNPQVVQRLYMPKDEKSLADMVKWFAVFGLAYTLMVTLVGLYARAAVEAGTLAISPASKDQVTPQILSVIDPLSAAIIFTSIIAASASTADSILLTLSSSVAVDLARGDDKRRLRIGVVSITIVAVIMAAIALARVSYIVKLSVLSSLILLSLAPATIAGWLGVTRRSPLWSGASILSGPVIVGVVAAIKGSPLKAFGAVYLNIPIAGWILIISTVLLLPAIGRAREA